MSYIFKILEIILIKITFRLRHRRRINLKYEEY